MGSEWTCNAPITLLVLCILRASSKNGSVEVHAWTFETSLNVFPAAFQSPASGSACLANEPVCENAHCKLES